MTDAPNRLTYDKIVAENTRYTLYSGLFNDRGILIARPKEPGSLSKNVFVIKELSEIANKIDKKHPEKFLNYGLGFPQYLGQPLDLIDWDENSPDDSTTWNAYTKDYIFAFRQVDKISSLIPLIKFWKTNKRIDLKSSAWICGKLLKTMSFAVSNKITLTELTGNNVLIEPDQHYVIVFDWSAATVHDTYAPSDKIRLISKQIAQLVIRVLGDLNIAKEEDTDSLYLDFLTQLAQNGSSDLSQTHADFYKIVDALCDNPKSSWERGYYKFKTLELNNG